MRSSVLPYLRLLALFCWVLGAHVATAQRKTPEEIQLKPPPPQPVPEKLEVVRDGQVEAPLHIYGRQTEALRFIIRTKPQFGKLTDFRPVDRESAAVVYHPPAALSVTTEKFSYSVQNSLGVSAPAEVVINIIDLAPVLIVQDEIDFPTLLAGQSSTQPLTIVNQGGGVTDGVIEVPSPWRIEGPTSYHLGKGQRQSFTVIFAPVVSGRFTGEIRYSSRPDRVTSLKGEAVAAISFNPPTVELHHLPDESVRSGATEIINHTGADETLRLRAGPRLIAPESVLVPAGGKFLLVIQTKPDDVAPLLGEIVFQGAGADYTLNVQAARVGPVLQCSIDPILIHTVTGRAGRATFHLRNIGGADGFFRFDAPPPLEVSPGECRLFAAEEKTIEVSLPAAEQTHYRSWLKVAGEQQSFEIPIEAEVGAKSVAPAERPRRLTTDIRAVAIDSTEEAPAPPEDAEPETGPIHRAPFPCTVIASTPNSVTLQWPAALSEANHFQVEWRKLTFHGETSVDETWLEIKKASFRTENGMIQAELRDLFPETIYTLRVVPIGSVNNHLPPLFQLKAATKPGGESVFTPMRILMFAFIICVGAILGQKLRQSQI